LGHHLQQVQVDSIQSEVFQACFESVFLVQASPPKAGNPLFIFGLCHHKKQPIWSNKELAGASISDSRQSITATNVFAFRAESACPVHSHTVPSRRSDSIAQNAAWRGPFPLNLYWHSPVAVQRNSQNRRDNNAKDVIFI
jgi:hypothetical protein